jgi:hypothetical protein
MANELMLPPYLYPTRMELELVDSVGVSRPLFGYAVSQRLDYGATRWRAKITFEKMTTSERHALLAFLNLAGRVRAILVPVYGEAQRGSGVFTELLTNNTFANGTTGWTAGSSALTVADRMMRVTALAAANAYLYQSTSLTQYAPVILRAVILDGAQTVGIAIGPALNDGVQTQISDYSTSRGLRTAQFTALGTSGIQYPGVFGGSTGFTAGAYFEVPWCSLSRCALVDNGPNALLRSDDFANAAWTKTLCSIPATSVTLPDGTSGTVNTLREDGTANDFHYVAQAVTVSSAAADFSFAVAVKPNNRSWVLVQINESTGNTSASVYFNVSTGAIGNISGDTNWSNVRAFMRNLGNGWYYCAVVGRKTNAATTITARIYVAEADGDAQFTGLNQDSHLIWRATLAQSSVPTRLVATTTAAVAATSQALSGALHTKGWLVSTNGLLNAGDFVNISLPTGLHLARLTAPLNTDAAGIGYLQFEPKLPEAPADNAAIIPNFPLLKCVLSEPPVVRTYPPGYISDVEIEVEGIFA